MSKRIVARANLLVFGVLLAILALVGIVTWERLNASREAREWSQHSYRVLGTMKDLAIALRDAETGQRGYVITGKDDYLAPYDSARDRLGVLQGELQKLTADNPAQQERLRALAPVIQHKLEELAQTVQLRRDVGVEAAGRLVNTDVGRGYMKEAETSLAAMLADEEALLARRLGENDARAAWVRWTTLGGSLLAVLALLWAARLLNQAWSRSYRTEAEQRTLALRLSTTLDSLSQGVAVFGPDRALTNWNECFQVLLDLRRAMIRPGTSYAALAEHTAETGRPVLETWDQVSHGGTGPREAVVYERSRADGHHLELRRTPMPDGGFVLTISDMTKRAQAEGVLREAQKMQAIGQLTGGIAHDFNNLLQVILGNLEFVRAKLDGDAKLQTRIERAAWAAQRGATLTGQLLAFARKQPLAPAAIDLAATMPDLVPLLRRTLGEHIEVRYVESAGLWPAMADPAQLESAVLNLALNARDAMPGGGRLTIELGNKVLDREYARHHAEVVPGDYAMVAVSDTGHGMTPEVAARVFEPFFTTKPDGKGTGLGLAMVFGFVKQSGGHVKIYSEPGHGTTVKIYLPRAIGQLAAVGGRTAAPVELPRGSATILVVEDEAAVREIACAILADLGYRVLDAADGEEALRVFGANAAAVDLLLTDVVLPGKVRGRELSERVQAVRPEVRVLFMSGYTENSIVHHGRLDDGVHLIGKPFKREQLALKVAEVIGANHSVETGNIVALRPKRDS
ncbi:signal transduction histidine kinase/CheY-like chemotaxis protein [Methylobacterium sp. PvP062]|jgi:signal transduction histidine kinase/CheY-like chemotaxis protein|uniref:histidine kinase n=2 Tax=Methylobacterium TaxID=407 RepID=A0A509E9R1_9HYPH|nr:MULTISPECIES: CHASE3 domain-containing protein [Methylobacterium]MCX7333299.1 CHASE3 domain-containing protein [Hyphomicrobiales bacterium]GAN46023.1 multi-sensor hybrid histidine kinase [Methylobacterium sp. ME121]MBN6818460.1 CHASE3 domain-containing protein [Methylobacterium organophilum]MBP2492881.1 signal transduction histidine kinase/CheY-like chemotaxis protein [Methylobacterium sp. PvP105]MBP2500747.1 signal transduction histidine kinase/CheY-like chemotaxis protein [Methylobacteriu